MKDFLKDCCEKCFQKSLLTGFYSCSYSACPCHTTTEKKCPECQFDQSDTYGHSLTCSKRIYEGNLEHGCTQCGSFSGHRNWCKFLSSTTETVEQSKKRGQAEEDFAAAGLSPTEKKCEQGFAKGECVNPKCPFFSTTDTSDWLERFKKQLWSEPSKDLIAFIAKEIERSREEGYVAGIGSQSERKQQMFIAGKVAAIAEVREMLSETENKRISTEEFDEGYRKCIQDLLDALSTLEK